MPPRHASRRARMALQMMLLLRAAAHSKEFAHAPQRAATLLCCYYELTEQNNTLRAASKRRNITARGVCYAILELCALQRDIRCYGVLSPCRRDDEMAAIARRRLR